MKRSVVILGSVFAAAGLLAACGSSHDAPAADAGGGTTSGPATSDAGGGTLGGTPDAGNGDAAASDAGVSAGEVFDPCGMCPGFGSTCTQAGTSYRCFRPAGAPGDQCPRDESGASCEPGYSCGYWSGVGCSANYCLCQDGDWRCTDYVCPESGDCRTLPGRDCDEVGASCDFDSLHCECMASNAGSATWSCRID